MRRQTLSYRLTTSEWLSAAHADQSAVRADGVRKKRGHWNMAARDVPCTGEFLVTTPWQRITLNPVFLVNFSCRFYTASTTRGPWKQEASCEKEACSFNSCTISRFDRKSNVCRGRLALNVYSLCLQLSCKALLPRDIEAGGMDGKLNGSLPVALAFPAIESQIRSLLLLLQKVPILLCCEFCGVFPSMLEFPRWSCFVSLETPARFQFPDFCVLWA